MKGWRLTLAVMYLLTQIVIVLVECHTVNKHLQIATFYNPLGRIENISTNSKGLMEKELLETLSKKMNFTYDITVSTDVLQFGFPGNESWSGVLGKLARKEADMTISFGPVSYPRFLSFDATVGIFRDHVVIMIPHPESGIDTSGLVSIFSPFTWILIAISLVIVAMALWFVNHFQHDRDDQINGGLLILYILGVTLSQGKLFTIKQIPFKAHLNYFAPFAVRYLCYVILQEDVCRKNQLFFEWSWVPGS
ncbi:hypothetical protein OUZ56_015888 [Daphnia magna]|uniref:Ionotropic glutamate receptor L-glutamate and glycine-binding domain-containing protein n=1 Tax=Daphnia magna TaxID=35525 RepID=A0ABR0AP14_9CRUS|nr:hypothetical protein OUZ56_015888 [Daphnia magna]